MAVFTWLVTSSVLGEEVQEAAASWSSPEDACPNFEAVWSPSALQSCENAVDLPSG